MKKKQNQNSAIRGIRIYDLDLFKKFQDICKAEYSNSNQEINKLIRSTVETGRLRERMQA